MFSPPLTTQRKTVAVPTLGASKHVRVRSLGFYKQLDRVPVEVAPTEGSLVFGDGEPILVLPRTAKYSLPTPADFAHPTDDRYRVLVFHKDTWQDAFLDQTLLPLYQSNLGPPARWTFDNVLLRHIVPYVCRRADIGSLAPVAALQKVKLYRFELPDTKVVEPAKPANARGPYELCETANGTRFYTVYWDSMTRAQKADYVEREVILPRRTRNR